MTNADPPSIDQALSGYLRALAESGTRQPERCGPFLAFVDPESDNPYRNYAIPDDFSEPTDAAVAELIAWFERRGRNARAEYFPRIAPLLEETLLAAGFVVEGRPPVMVCRPGGHVPISVPSGIALRRVTTIEDIVGAVTAAGIAFGEPSIDESDVARLSIAIEAGAGAVVAHDMTSGQAIASGQFSAPLGGISELVGIAVVPPYEGRGIGTALTARLLTEAFSSSVDLAWLSPGGPGAERIYQRVGFEIVSEALHIALARPG